MACVALLFRLFYLDSESIWMDEDMQAGHALTIGKGLDIVRGAARQQQPPLDYFAEGVCLKIFGVTTVGARIHAVLFGVLAAVVFSLLIRRVCSGNLPFVFGSAAFVTHPWLIRYSQEGRPPSCGVFFATLYLYVAIVGVVVEPRARSPLRFFLAVFAAALGLLLSIGFQPVVFLLTSAIVLLPFIAFKKYRAVVLLHHGALFAALVAAWPILWRTVAKGGQYLRENDSWIAMVKTAFGGFHFPEGSTVAAELRVLTGGTPLLWALLGVAGAAGMLFLRSKERAEPAPRALLAYAAAFTALFLPLFDILFDGFIAYRIVARYYLTVVPVFLLAAALLFAEATRAATWIVDRAKRPAVRGVRFLPLAVAVALIALQITETFREVYFNRENADWRALYGLLNREPPGEARAYMMNLNRIDRYHPYFFARRFYYTGSPLPVRLYDGERLPGQLAAVSSVGTSFPFRKILLTTMYGFHKVLPEAFENIDGVQVHRFTGLSVIEIQDKGDLKRQAVDVLKRLRKSAGRSEANYKPVVMLADIYLIDGKQKQFETTLKDLKKMDKRGKLAPKILALEKKSAGIFEK